MFLAGTSAFPRPSTASRHPQVHYEGGTTVQTSLLGPTPSRVRAQPPKAREEIRGAASLSLSPVRAVRVQDRLVLRQCAPRRDAASSAQKIASTFHGENLRHDLHQSASRHQCGRPSPRNGPICGSHDEGNQDCSRNHRRGATFGSYDLTRDIAQVTRHTRCCRIGCHSWHQTRGVVVDQVRCCPLRRARIDCERRGERDDALGRANVRCAGR